MGFEYTNKLKKIGRSTKGYFDSDRNATLYIGGGSRGYHTNTLVYEYDGEEKRMEITVHHKDALNGKFEIQLHGQERYSLPNEEKKHILSLIQDSVTMHLNDKYRVRSMPDDGYNWSTPILESTF